MFYHLQPLHTELLQDGLCKCTFSFHLTYSSFLRGLVRSTTPNRHNHCRAFWKWGKRGGHVWLSQYVIASSLNQDVKSPANWQAVL